MKLMRAAEIAKILGDATFWHSHSRGISMKRLMEDNINLRICDYGKISELNQYVSEYHKATKYILGLLNVQNCVHTQQQLWRI